MDSNTVDNQANNEEIETLEYKPTLSAAEAASLEEKFAEIEHNRKKLYQLFIILVGIMFAGSIFYIIVFQYEIIAYLLISGLIVFFIVKIKFDAYKKLYKDNMEDICLKKTFGNVVNKPDMGMDQNVVFGTNVLVKGNIYKSDSNVLMIILNAVYFKGQWFVFQLDNSVSENIYIADKWFGIREIQPNSDGSKSYIKVVPQDQTIDRRYDVFAKSQNIGK